MVAGAIGAVAGDSALYWLARLSRTRFQAQLDRALENPKVAGAMGLIGSSAPLLLCVGRYVPGLRFVVNASCGLAPYPYRSFLLWSTIGGSLWSVVTCLTAYTVATALGDNPIAAVVLSSVVSTVAVALVFVVVRRGGGQPLRRGWRRPLPPGRSPPQPVRRPLDARRTDPPAVRPATRGRGSRPRAAGRSPRAGEPVGSRA